MKKAVILSIILLLAGSCIDPLDLDIDDQAEMLVVDGMITNEPGPYSVRLSRSKPYDTYADSWSAVETGATVILSDDQGNQETLAETAPGLYQTSEGGMQGQLGSTYTLSIRTKSGQTYTSLPETLRPVPPIDSLYFEVRPQQILNEADVEETIYMADVLVDAPDPAQEKNYYLWQWQSTFQVNTQPWDYAEKIRGVRVPMPKACCEVCWITSPTGSVNVQDDRLIDGGTLSRHVVTSIPVTEQAFGTKYHLEVKQLSVSEAAYDYWRILKAQIENGGSIQDPPPATITGNITNTATGEPALGFFGASAVTRRSLDVRREDLGVRVGQYIFPDDCRVIANSTTERPAFW
ncbi:uncharacterized protein DUF4249 [Pontibacter mucosus]|uniref:Uncharacterized protein DUF4249 n=1 Tax=Pontibacter mucosus TaxID=1649266 RepID=A0A2T5Y7J1_9BACT|nr:DUF4249 domain-containing protein [Pontibacter mucosus]PTX12294.1 uncharacterized protein DUF4249 [Pontibacter mucosus]